MGLSTERKVFMGVLFVAGAALVIDRGVLGPSSASASTDAPAGVPSDALLVDPAEHAAPTESPNGGKTMAQVLMDRLGSIQGSQSEHTLSSAFSLEQLMPDPTEMLEQIEDAEPDGFALNQLIPSEVVLPTLGAVMPSERGGGGAIIDGKMIRVGQTSEDGFTLREVRERSVILVRDGRMHVVEMPMQIQP